MPDSHSEQDPARAAQGATSSAPSGGRGSLQGSGPDQTDSRRLLGCDKVLAVHIEQLKFDFSRAPGGDFRERRLRLASSWAWLAGAVPGVEITLDSSAHGW